MAVFKYTASMSKREDFTESGTVVASSEEEAKRKLKSLNFDRFNIRRVGGLMGLVGRFTATVK